MAGSAGSGAGGSAIVIDDFLLPCIQICVKYVPFASSLFGFP